MKKTLLGLLALVVLAALAYLGLTPGTQEPSVSAPAAVESPSSGPGRALPDASGPITSQRTDGILRIVDDVAVKNYGEVIYRGPIDLTATIERIRAGERHPHRNDGSVFGNREGLLPRKPRGYYKEYVHPTESLDGPGPQRLVVGRDGDWWYTPDHYASFVALGETSR